MSAEIPAAAIKCVRMSTSIVRCPTNATRDFIVPAGTAAPLGSLWCKSVEMAAALQPGEQQKARQSCDHAKDVKPRPACAFGHKTGARRQIGAADRGERGQQRVLRGRMAGGGG